MKEYPYRLLLINEFPDDETVKHQAQEELGSLGKVTVVKWEVEREYNVTANTLHGNMPWRFIPVKLTYTIE